jgi:hypothetical protein
MNLCIVIAILTSRAQSESHDGLAFLPSYPTAACWLLLFVVNRDGIRRGLHSVRIHGVA